ncbi:TPA: hypothetical protein DIC38_00995 [Candidatus Nomurabacteria bacterium]|nr:MAG: hypothetical protein O210_OD1C00001G0532 [Parcubacteria bacterium RAAC4_OD1_1]HCY26245.1 hypothetical protein [Candidatus Nomurabacteria bacterium]
MGIEGSFNKTNEIEKKENNTEFSKELQNGLIEVRDMIQNIRDDAKNLLSNLEDARIPYNRYDKERENRSSDGSFTIRSMYLNNMSWQLENFDDENIKNDPNSLLKAYGQIKEAIDHLENKFKIYGYHDDQNKGGDVLSKDYPEIASQIDLLSGKLKEIQERIPEIENRLDAQKKFKAIKSRDSVDGQGDFIPLIRFVNRNGNINSFSHKIGYYRTPEELINNSEKYIDQVLKKSMEDFKASENYSDEEKDIFIDRYEKSILGINDYLDEFKKLNQIYKI